MRPWPARSRARPQAGVGGDPLEREVDVAVGQPRACGRREQRRRRLGGDRAVAAAQVAAQRRDRAGVQRQLAGLAELAVADDQQLVLVVDVAAVKADRLADTHPGDRQHADQRAQRRCAVCGRDDARRVHQREHLAVGVEVGDPAARAPHQQIGGRHLVGGIDRVQVRCETADDGQPLAVPVGACGRRQRRPRQGQLGRDRVRTSLVEPGEELGQQLAGALELVAQRATDCQVLIELALEPAHDRAPGHGRASVRSASRSTLA